MLHAKRNIVVGPIIIANIIIISCVNVVVLLVVFSRQQLHTTSNSFLPSEHTFREFKIQKWSSKHALVLAVHNIKKLAFKQFVKVYSCVCDRPVSHPGDAGSSLKFRDVELVLAYHHSQDVLGRAVVWLLEGERERERGKVRKHETPLIRHHLGQNMEFPKGEVGLLL